MWTIRFAKSRMRKSRTSGILWGVYDRKGCTYSTYEVHEEEAYAEWNKAVRGEHFDKIELSQERAFTKYC